ncbi:DUF4062 domain-containing protein [Janibacter sp. LM]|uniref:DUF4062 domain-containing protein n=1 Tax=Janibacter sp. LM TaxID=3144845 RepID=UPI0031F604F3
MTFAATAVQLLIASPGDTQDERTAILSEASRWNGRHAKGRGFILSPWLYELHSTPILGDRAQAIINSQGVDKSDVVVAVFGSRLGTDTGVDISGTAEEINRAISLGIPVHVYFSKGDLPNDVDTEQLELLRMFREDLMRKGLCGNYQDPRDLARQVIDALEYDLDAFESVPLPTAPAGVRLRVTHDHQTEQKGVNARSGKMEYRHVIRDLVITNAGDTTAEQLRFTVKTLSDDDHVHLGVDTDEEGWVTVGDLTDGSSRAFQCFPSRGRCDVEVITEWAENGTTHTKTFTTQIT